MLDVRGGEGTGLPEASARRRRPGRHAQGALALGFGGAQLVEHDADLRRERRERTGERVFGAVRRRGRQERVGCRFGTKVGGECRRQLTDGPQEGRLLALVLLCHVPGDQEKDQPVQRAGDPHMRFVQGSGAVSALGRVHQLEQGGEAFAGQCVKTIRRAGRAIAKGRHRLGASAKPRQHQSQRVRAGDAVRDGEQHRRDGRDHAKPEQRVQQRFFGGKVGDRRAAERLGVGDVAGGCGQDHEVVGLRAAEDREEAGEKSDRTERRAAHQQHGHEDHQRHERNAERGLRERARQHRHGEQGTERDRGGDHHRAADRGNRITAGDQQQQKGGDRRLWQPEGFPNGKHGQHRNQHEQGGMQPVPGRRQRFQGGGSQRRGLALVDERRLRRVAAHRSIMMEAVAPIRIRSGGGSSSKIRTGKRCAMRTHSSERGTSGRPFDTAPSSGTTPPLRLST